MFGGWALLALLLATETPGVASLTTGGLVPLAAPAADPAGDADASQRQTEASIEQVQADLKRMATFGSEVRRSLDEADKAKTDVEQALGAWRRQSELQQQDRDASKAKVVRLEEEVATLQGSIKELQAEKASLTSDKATLTEANRKVLSQLSSMFSFGQSVQTGLAFKGLAQPTTAAGTTNSSVA